MNLGKIDMNVKMDAS